MGGIGHDYSGKDTIYMCRRGGRRGTRVRKTAGWGGNLARSKGAAIFAPEARSCANWKSHLSFNKGTGRGEFKMLREVRGDISLCAMPPG